MKISQVFPRSGSAKKVFERLNAKPGEGQNEKADQSSAEGSPFAADESVKHQQNSDERESVALAQPVQGTAQYGDELILG
ncbi:MAG: hypothetical protein A2901_02555 [Elusimicrobia bacterium RIFCSPLOWO2_01_FULL_54_10]|nr:MAG: hypothetical protein A2901_02555 [Elusimicrobia bacterium RIFCSPLOWO2_01_FULL_54_10]